MRGGRTQETQNEYYTGSKGSFPSLQGSVDYRNRDLHSEFLIGSFILVYELIQVSFVSETGTDVAYTDVFFLARFESLSHSRTRLVSVEVETPASKL